MSFIDIVTRSTYFYPCISQEHSRIWGGERFFLKKQTFICLSLSEILVLKMQSISKAEKKRRDQMRQIILYLKLQISE